jgi:hypothetical protein
MIPNAIEFKSYSELRPCLFLINLQAAESLDSVPWLVPYVYACLALCSAVDHMSLLRVYIDYTVNSGYSLIIPECECVMAIV